MSPVIRWTEQPVFRDAPLPQKGAEEKTSREIRDLSRRILNVGVAAGSLLAVSPLFVIIAVAVKLSSPGPVFFTQERVGLDRRRRPRDRRARARGTGDRRRSDSGGKLFRMYKFRTMYVDQESNQAQVWAKRDDPRITPVGRVLRAFRFDELPQLLNVILGQMNIVGPRPEQPEIFRKLRAGIFGYQKRQRVLPGITGWAQINNGYDKSLEDVQRKLGYDLEYLDRRSTVEDFKIMAKTLPVVLNRKGYH
jgi:lipopolysaccharide/colanic/teichoic acid biosynthesis glycosyltransferase